MKKNKKMLWVLHEGGAGGANLALGEHLEMLSGMGYSIRIISRLPGEFPDRMRARGIHCRIVFFYLWIRSLDSKNDRRLKRILRNMYAIFQILPEIAKTDIICTNTLCTDVGAVAARLLGKPHYWFIHEFGEEDQGFRISLSTPKAYRLMAFLSRKIVVNSHAVMKKWEKYVDRKKLSLLYNLAHIRVTGDPGLSPEERPLKLLILGQVIRGKGHRDGIMAVKILRDKGFEVHLDIIGSAWDKTYLLELETLITQNNLEQVVKILTPVLHPEQVYPRYHALLMCSVSEALGRVTIEALKCGIPVIASRNGGTPEIVDEGKNGLFYEGGKPEYLAEQIQKITDPDIYRELKSGTREVFRKFNPEAVKHQLEQIFDQ